MGALVAATPDDFDVLAGSPSTFHASLCAGATGGILALGLVAPEACVRLFELTRAGRQDEARALQQQLLPLAKLLGSTYGVPGLKAALGLVGCDTGWPRPPLGPLDPAAVTQLADALASFNAAAAQGPPRAHVS
jgi:4-hydroxy-2-oxoglutarate aldolase